jgi:hypothetical protein
MSAKISLVASLKAEYSLSVVDSAMSVCSFDAQTIEHLA